MSDIKSYCKTEIQGDNHKGVNTLGIPFFSIRKSDLYYHFLPAFYFLILISLFILLYYYEYIRENFELEKFMVFIHTYKYEFLIFLIPLIFISLKLLGILISAFSSRIITKITRNSDEEISSTTYKEIGKNKIIIKYISDFYIDDKINEDNLNDKTTYWYIFNYVMDYYYAQENIYDDLRRTIFIRNLVGTNIIIGVLLLMYIFIIKPLLIPSISAVDVFIIFILMLLIIIFKIRKVEENIKSLKNFKKLFTTKNFKKLFTTKNFKKLFTTKNFKKLFTFVLFMIFCFIIFILYSSGEVFLITLILTYLQISIIKEIEINILEKDNSIFEKKNSIFFIWLIKIFTYFCVTIIMYSMFGDKIILSFIITLFFLGISLSAMYESNIKSYHKKLIRTFIYINANIKNLNK